MDFSGHPCSVCSGRTALFAHPLALVSSLVAAESLLVPARAAAPSADGLGWHSLQGPGWVGCRRCVEVGAQSIQSSVSTDWRQAEK